MASNKIGTLFQGFDSDTHTHVESSQPSQSLNLVSSTSTSLQSSTNRKPRASWTDDHIVKVTEGGVIRKRCHNCLVAWSSTTSTRTIAKHLGDKHRITNNNQETTNSKKLIQSSIEPTKALSNISERRSDKGIL
jgi:hypothetical protein